MFCGQCGARLTQAARPPEYKQVTVLFADVVRSMAIAAALDIERLRDVMTDVVERSAAIVRRYGGTVEYNGDGVMGIFGAPIALENHAFRACLAALAIQDDMTRLAADVQLRDNVALHLRVGLNSGQVIAGAIGSGSLGYAATGEAVGFAQRIESVAPPGAALLSESTARLVEHTAVLAAPELVHIKGAEEPVRAYRLVALSPPDRQSGRAAEATLVGRRCEMAALDAMLDRGITGRGGVVTVVGSPGIGKSRTARDVAALAGERGVRVVWTFCESHAQDVPFHAVTQLLRAAMGIVDGDDVGARATVRQRVPDAAVDDLLLLDDLLGIGDPDIAPVQVDAQPRRRRLTALINGMSLARTEPTLFIVEDAHWIDAVSESMLTEFLDVIPDTPSMVLITARPEYRGALTHIDDAHAITLGPLEDSDISALLGQLLGPDATVVDLAALIAGRAAGNPFFAEEMVRELAQRGVLTGGRGSYVCADDVAEVSVPGTVQAAIGARIDRLTPTARRTLNAASVIGARFDAELLDALGFDPLLEELLAVDLIDQVQSIPVAAYAFRHPLIRAVAYESQLKSDRAQWHRRLAAAIQDRAQGSLEENAALIAEHLETAGDLHAAYDWRMRAGTWSTNRDLAAARISWERACRIADRLAGPAAGEDPDQLAMRIAPRTLLCATDWQAREVQESRTRFAELRELCDAAGDKVSLAIGMTALITELVYAGRAREGSQLASEQMALLESIDDPTPLMGLAGIAFVNWLGVLEFDEILRWSQTIVDWAGGDPAKGAGYGVGSPLAIALAWRGTARWCLGRPGWRRDLSDAVAMGRRSNAETFSGVVAWTYGFAMQYGVLRANDVLMRNSEEAVRTANRASSDRAVGLAAYTLAVGLLNQDDEDDRRRGLDAMMRVRDIWLHKRALFLIPATDIWAARDAARSGDRDAAIIAMRQAADELRRGHSFYGVWGTGVLVETLVERGAHGDLAEAEETIDRLAGMHAGHSSAMLDITLLRVRTLLARARGDESFLDLLGHYRAKAESLGFEGHIAWARAMADGD